MCEIWVWSLGWASLVAQGVKSSPAMQEAQVRSLGPENPLQKAMATHSSILAWRIPWTEEPGGLRSVHKVTKSRTGMKQLSMHAQRNRTFYFGVSYRLFHKNLPSLELDWNLPNQADKIGKCTNDNIFKEFLAVWWLGLSASTVGDQSLVGELKPCKLQHS